jgi:branched-chain amino acid transport system substrate-binding protein
VIERPAERASRLPAGETMNRVAVLAPLTGPTGNVGQALLNAVQLAMADMSEARVRITPYDTAGGANEAAARAIAEGNGLILGPLLAEDVRAIAPMARAADVPVIAFSNDISVAGDGVYLMGLNPAQSIDRVVRHARAQGATRFGALAPQGLYGERAAAALRASVEASGGQLNGVQSYDRSAGAARAAATRLMAAAAARCACWAPNCGQGRAISAPTRRCAGPGSPRRPTRSSTSSAPATAPAIRARRSASRPWAMTPLC